MWELGREEASEGRTSPIWVPECGAGGRAAHAGGGGRPCMLRRPQSHCGSSKLFIRAGWRRRKRFRGEGAWVAPPWAPWADGTAGSSHCVGQDFTCKRAFYGLRQG